MLENLIKLIEATGMVDGKNRCSIIAEELISNGVTIPVRCKDCFANDCCSIQIDLNMGGEGYCPKGRKENRC